MSINIDAPLVKRFLAIGEPVPFDWTVVYSGPDYQVIAMRDRRAEVREAVLA